tara:strand:+ start:19 stop:387 length:369 start_codon:yes stop_codon:yes gene_type:complete
MKKFRDFYEAVASVVQRKKMQRRMAKMAKSPVIQLKKQRARLKMRSPAKLAILARKKTIQSFRDKFYPGYGEMSLQQRVKVDQMVMQKYGKKIDKISKKAAKILQKQEVERIKKAKEAQKDA